MKKKVERADVIQCNLFDFTWCRFILLAALVGFPGFFPFLKKQMYLKQILQNSAWEKTQFILTSFVCHRKI